MFNGTFMVPKNRNQYPTIAWLVVKERHWISLRKHGVSGTSNGYESFDHMGETCWIHAMIECPDK